MMHNLWRARLLASLRDPISFKPYFTHKHLIVFPVGNQWDPLQKKELRYTYSTNPDGSLLRLWPQPHGTHFLCKARSGLHIFVHPKEEWAIDFADVQREYEIDKRDICTSCMHMMRHAVTSPQSTVSIVHRVDAPASCLGGNRGIR